jgi:hypothetical protein
LVIKDQLLKMLLKDLIVQLTIRFKTGTLIEYGCSVYLEKLIRNLIPVIEGSGNENVIRFQKITGLTFIPEKEPEGTVCYLNNPEVRADYKFTFTQVDLLDYIYAVLHSVSIRGQYKEFVTREFPWVPYPKDSQTFWKLVELGGELRRTHLLESSKIMQHIPYFPVSGTNHIEKFGFKIYDNEEVVSKEHCSDYLGAVYINEDQFFADVTISAWELIIGGTQPAQTWLKERKGKILSNEEISYYQKILVALSETCRLIEEVDKIEIE